MNESSTSSGDIADSLNGLRWTLAALRSVLGLQAAPFVANLVLGSLLIQPWLLAMELGVQFLGPERIPCLQRKPSVHNMCTQHVQACMTATFTWLHHYQ